jgi:hypothetical protein
MTDKPSRTKVRVIREEGQSAIVQYQDATGAPRQVVVATEKIEDGEVHPLTLRAAPRHGTDFATIAAKVSRTKLTHTGVAETIARDLNGMGIWTSEDLIARKREARLVVQSAFSAFFAELVAAAVTADAEVAEEEGEVEEEVVVEEEQPAGDTEKTDDDSN